MAETLVTITAANFQPSSNAEYINGILDETVTQGQTAAMLSSGRYGVADSDSGTAEKNTTVGLFATAGSQYQPCRILTYDPNLAIGGTIVKGSIYVMGATAGRIAVVDGTNPATGCHTQFLGHGNTTAELYFKPIPVSSPAV